MTLANPIIHERRILGVLQLRDAPTGESLRRPMTLRSEQLSFIRNLSGLFAITGLRPVTAAEQTLAAHLSSFTAAPAQPAAGTVNLSLTVEDPEGRYLPRLAQIALPRGDDWDQPIAIDLYPASSSPVAPNWSGIRATLEQGPAEDRRPIAGARVRILRDQDGEELGLGYSDQRGEVLAVAVGIPVVDFTTTPAPGAPAGVGAKTVVGRLEITTGPGEVWPPDPSAIATNGQAWEPVTGDLPKPELRTGRLETADLALHLQPSP